MGGSKTTAEADDKRRTLTKTGGVRPCSEQSHTHHDTTQKETRQKRKARPARTSPQAQLSHGHPSMASVILLWSGWLETDGRCMHYVRGVDVREGSFTRAGNKVRRMFMQRTQRRKCQHPTLLNAPCRMLHQNGRSRTGLRVCILNSICGVPAMRVISAILDRHPHRRLQRGPLPGRS